MAGRRAVETSYSGLKMFAIMKLRLTEFYKDPVLGAGMAAMAIGYRDARYAPYREARFPATKYAKAADLYGAFTGQFQAAIMNIRKLGIDQAGSKLEEKCRAIYAYVDTHGLNSVKINGLSAGDAVLAYFGCIELPKPTTSEEEEETVKEIEEEIDKILEAKKAGTTTEVGSEQTAQQQAVETNVQEVAKNVEKAVEQTIQQASGQAAQQTGA